MTTLAAKDILQTPLPSPRGLDEEAKHAFMRMISHELRTPLNSIIGFSEVLKQQPCGPLGAPQYLEYANIIGASGTKMLRLVNQIVEIVRLESHAADLDLRPEPLEALVEEVLQSLRYEAEGLGVRLFAEDMENLPWVLADARGVKVILTNLLQNAMVQTPAAEPVVVRARRAGHEVVIEVEDRGPGADMLDAPRLLRPFQKGPTPVRTDGAGLGLPIALLFARAMGGDLDIRTARGEGFTAIVTLPAP